MTNLFEKSLLTGFGIFTLILFIIIISPFIQEIKEYEKSDKDNDLDEFIIFINEIDKAINHFIEYSDKSYLIKIEIPNNINISFINNFAKFDFLLENQIHTKVINYEEQFIETYYNNLLPGVYYLNISNSNSLINIKFSILNE